MVAGSGWYVRAMGSPYDRWGVLPTLGDKIRQAKTWQRANLNRVIWLHVSAFALYCRLIPTGEHDHPDGTLVRPGQSGPEEIESDTGTAYRAQECRRRNQCGTLRLGG